MRRPLVLFLALGAAACGGERPSPAASPVSPTPVAASPQFADYAGTWRVTYHVDSCIGRYCFLRINREATLELRLLQLGDRVSGLMIADGGNGDVEGHVAPDGTLTLMGVTPRPIPSLSWSTFDLKRFEVRIDPERGLTGTLHYEARLDGDYSGYSTGASGPVVAGQRLPPEATLSGRWTGAFNTTSCLPGPYCLLDHWGEVELVLEQIGEMVTGTVRVPGLSASVSGSAASGAGELTVQTSGTTGQLVLRPGRLGLASGSLVLRSPRWDTEAVLQRVVRMASPGS